ncbi:MAG: hypothetical protein QM731_24500 [Chitinophagaceae bacterium]
MQQKLRYPLLLTAAIFVFLSGASAKVWRVNNNGGVNADFAQLSTAVASASVLAGDTLYVEGSATGYSSVTLRKKLVIIGPGYFLSGAGANTGLQANPNNAQLTLFDIDSLASGSTIIGLQGYVRIYSNADDITLTRCYLGLEVLLTGQKMMNLTINKCYLSLNLNASVVENLQVTNCYLYSWFYAPNAISVLARNNVIAVSPNISNTYFANNIFSGVTLGSVINSTYKNNLANTNILPATNNNQNSIALTSIFTGTGSTDGQYKLKAGSPAIGAGETVNGVTPDCGMFGTADPYVLSGIAPIPTIYSLTVPTSVPSTATSMQITVSTRSNN